MNNTWFYLDILHIRDVTEHHYAFEECTVQSNAHSSTMSHLCQAPSPRHFVDRIKVYVSDMFDATEMEQRFLNIIVKFCHQFLVKHDDILTKFFNNYSNISL